MKIYIMNLSNKILNFIFHLDFWKDYKLYRKSKSVLYTFFKEEDSDLQKAFIANFDYPDDMTSSPVRFENNSGDVYYTINFKSKELFENSGTKEKALSNSLVILDKYLPLGITQHIEPQAPIHIPNTFTILCSLKLISEINIQSVILNFTICLLKVSVIISFFAGLVKYLLF